MKKEKAVLSPDSNPIIESGSGISRTASIALSQAHITAVNRQRRIIVQFDAVGESESILGVDIDKWIQFRFNFADEPGTHIDTICWDIGIGGDCLAVYPSKVLPPLESPGLKKWWDAGIDLVKVCVDESKRRNLEVFWNHRICEVDVPANNETEKFGEYQHPLKKVHPDWLIKSWWPQGLWNLAVPEVREHKVKVLRELAENYDFDGFQLDFSRHIPCLPPGQQWENREHATEFVRSVRLMLLDVEAVKGQSILLSVKVPENLEGCHIDGFDVETWMQENLVDMLSLGSRSIDADIAAFRQIRSLYSGKNIKLYPCFDSHHTTEAYYNPPLEFLRGIYANWWQQGADGVETFNWLCATDEMYDLVGIKPELDTRQYRQAYHEIGNPAAMQYKDKIFVIQRRGGYPYREGYCNSNNFAQLPTDLANDDRTTNLVIHISDDAVEAEKAGKLKEIYLRMVVFSAAASGTIDMTFNGIPLKVHSADDTWKDPQIFSPKPAPVQVPAKWAYGLDSEQKLLLLVFKILPENISIGENLIELRVANRKSYPACINIKVEKVEVHVNYR